MAEFLQWIGDRGKDIGGYASGACSIPITEFPLSPKLAAGVPEGISHMAVDLTMWGRDGGNMTFNEQVTPSRTPSGVVLSMGDFRGELEARAAECGWMEEAGIPDPNAWEVKEEVFEGIGEGRSIRSMIQ